MKKILFVAAHRPDRSPSQRFRFEQYLKYLEENGYKYEFSFLVSPEDDRYLYKKGHYIRKFFFLLKSFIVRTNDALKAQDFDIIFVQREALLFRSFFFERIFKKKSKLVFDFDDSIWLMDVSEGNKNWKWLKNPGKTKEIIKISDMVFAGNSYLASFARQNNNQVFIIPTTIDTNEYIPQKDTRIEKVCIGWSGSVTTIKHFEYAIPFLLALKKKYPEKILIKVIGDNNFSHPELEVMSLSWNKENELKELNSFDIGIMPLPNDKWAKGKCGLKGIQYMALEIPTVMSPVGVNTEIIEDGINGFLASNHQEWIEKLSALIESPGLRQKLGKAGRQTVIERYSLESQKDRYLQLFNSLCER